MQKSIPKRVLGIDHGLSRIGLAISDERQTIALPLQVVKAEKKLDQTIQNLLQAITDICSKYACEISEIVIGLPLMMNGTRGSQAEEVQKFVQFLSEKTSIPIKTWDERLTSSQAERSLRESHMNRKDRSKFVDTVSATIILQTYLDSRPLLKL